MKTLPVNECPGVNENFALRVVLNSSNLAISTPHRLSRVLLRCVVAVGQSGPVAPSVTPPSIAIEAPVLGGPERVRARCVEQQQLREQQQELRHESSCRSLLRATTSPRGRVVATRTNSSPTAPRPRDPTAWPWAAAGAAHGAADHPLALPPTGALSDLFCLLSDTYPNVS